MLGVGHTVGTGLASTGPPGSGGTTYAGALGVGLGGLSPGSLSTLVVSARYQLLLGPETTPGGLVYQRFQVTLTSARDSYLWTPGESSNTQSVSMIMVKTFTLKSSAT